MFPMKFRSSILALGVFVHAVLLYSIFDVYYTSPLVHGTRPQPITKGKGLADRLVIFSADGLRADLFYQYPEKSPFLHGIITENKAFWGVSISHVPTESRPGHVALLAGFYEDVSAVARGWKHNPVSFDSIVNRSHETWAWGSPDIVSMFTDDVDHAHGYVYSSKMQDFQLKNASQLDIWVFDRVQEFFENATDTLKARLKLDRVVFFLHLLGLDTIGHGNKPTSDKYRKNIAVVDSGIAKVVELFDEFYEDNRTAYIFTSDHGMTDWGSHGAGTDAELITPMILWGSGVRQSGTKAELNQIDLSALMSALLGLPVPMNSVGTVPLQALSASPRYLFQAIYANFKQMLEQYIIKRNEKKLCTLPFLFRDYPDLRKSIMSRIEVELQRLVKQKRFEAATAICLKWISVIRLGLYHFHRHDRGLLGIAITSSFLCWILLVYLFATRRWTETTEDGDVICPKLSGFYLVCATFATLSLNGLPFMHCVYVTLPVYLTCVCNNLRRFESQGDSSLWKLLKKQDRCSYMRCLYIVPAAVSLLCILIIAFIYRSVISVQLILLGFVPFLKGKSNHRVGSWQKLWTVCCCVMAVYPQFPVVGQFAHPALCILSSLFFSYLLMHLSNQPGFSASKKFLQWQSALHLFVVAIISGVEVFSERKQILFVLRVFSWLLLSVSGFIPFFASQALIVRLVSWFSSIFLPYSLLSLSYEPSFLILLFVLLGLYVRLQFDYIVDEEFLILSLSKQNKQQSAKGVRGPFTINEWEQGIVFIILTEAAFFGSGNVASLNSFNPSFLRCFVSVFSPFLMTTMLVGKIALPFLAIGLTYAIVLHLQNISISRLSSVLLIITNTMAMVFFFRLVEDGSWFEIGRSISHYVICMIVSAVVHLFLHLTEYLLPLRIRIAICISEYFNILIPSVSTRVKSLSSSRIRFDTGD